MDFNREINSSRVDLQTVQAYCSIIRTTLSDNTGIADYSWRYAADSKCTFHANSLLKHSRRGTHQAPIELYSFKTNESLCVVCVLQEYLNRTRKLRGDCPNLFVTLLAPHTAATISRWLKVTLAWTGMDTSVFTAHSTRSASTSAAKDSGTPINAIMSAAGWTNASTFAKFYQNMTDTEKNLGQAIMTRYLTKK